MPRRKDGEPNERVYSVYSTNQRIVVLTFPDQFEAEFFDELSDDEITYAIQYAMTTHYGFDGISREIS